MKLAVDILEGGSTDLKLPRFVKPSGRRWVKLDGLIQRQIVSLAVRGGGSKIAGLVKSVGKRKQRRLSVPSKPVL